MKLFFKKIRWYVLTAICSIAVTLIFVFGHKWFPTYSSFDLQTFLIAIGIIVALAGVFWSTRRQINNSNASVSRQIKNQNRESHRPYIIIDNVKQIRINEKIERFNSWYAIRTKRIDENNGFAKMNKRFEICISNIGYGVAKDVTLYQLFSGREMMLSFRNSRTAIQLSTFDIANARNRNVVFDITFFSKKYEQISEKENGRAKFVHNYSEPDYFECILFYRDLNNNIYATVVTFNLYAFDADDYIYVDENTAGFTECLDSCNANYHELKLQYSKRILDIQND